jgi:hypothetical protein
MINPNGDEKKKEDLIELIYLVIISKIKTKPRLTCFIVSSAQ